MISGLAVELDLGVTLQTTVRKALAAGAVAVLALVVVRLTRRAIPKAVRRIADVAPGGDDRLLQRCQTLSGLLVSVVGVAVYGLAALTILGVAGIPLGPLIASAGVVGLAVGFGAQQLVRDVISGFFVLVEDQYGVGDSVTAGGVTGTVEALTLRLTKIRGDDGTLHHVRNGDLGVVSNASRGWAAVTVQVPVPAGADAGREVDRMRAAMAGLVERGEVDGLLLADPAVLGLAEVRPDNGVALIAITARSRPEGRAAVRRVLLREATAALARSREEPAEAQPRKPAARKAAVRAGRSGR